MTTLMKFMADKQIVSYYTNPSHGRQCAECKHRQYDSHYDEQWCGHMPQPEGLATWLAINNFGGCDYWEDVEMAAELDLDDVAAQSKKAAAELSDLRATVARLQNLIASAPVGVSDSADFDLMTWTFQIRNGCRVGGGHYALVCLREIDDNAKERGE